MSVDPSCSIQFELRSTNLVLLQATESHLGTGNVLLGVLEVLKESVLVPDDTLLLVGVGVGEALGLARLAAKQTVEVRSDLVLTASLKGVALSAAGLEEVSTLSFVACRVSVSW